MAAVVESGAGDGDDVDADQFGKLDGTLRNPVTESL
jgi:hypothetical protein